MARKRMFDNAIINQDSFVDMPSEAKALYFLLGMEADDEGFVAPKKILRWHNISIDSLKILIAKDFLIPFESGVVVITDWKRNNYLDKNRTTETIYLEEKKLLNYDELKMKYVFNGSTLDVSSVKQMLNESLTDVKPMLNQNRIEENRIEESRGEKKKKKTSLDTIIENYTSNQELQQELKNHLKVRKQKKGALTDRAIELELKTLDKLAYNDDETKIQIVQQSVERGWIGFFEVKEEPKRKMTDEEELAMYEQIDKDMEEGKYDYFGI